MNFRRLCYSALAAVVSVGCTAPRSDLAQSSATSQSSPASLSQLEWAYPVPPDAPAAARQDDGAPHRVPGSSQAFTVSQVRDAFNVADWHPEGHAPMPDVVAHGREPDVRGCGYCHLPNGQGRPENSGLAGLPAAYIVQQIADFKSGLRKSSQPKMRPPNSMIALAKNATGAEVQSAAAYFSSLQFQQWIRVVESNSVPKTHVAGSMLVALEEGGTEPIGQRIIEIPEDLERTELRDSASGFVAYVPVGSIQKGEELVTTGGAGKTIQCGICHGADLKGLAHVPGLAGRSPSYIVRQLYDMQTGARNGPWSPLMLEAVAKLTVDDLVAIAAYTASRKP